MGRKYGDAETNRTEQRVPYKITKAPNGDTRVTLDGREYSPPEISAMILGKLKTDAEAFLGEPVTQAVITVPAYFNDAVITSYSIHYTKLYEPADRLRLILI